MSTSKMLLLLFFICGAHATFVKYDAYYGRPASEQDVKRFEAMNNTFWCLNEISLPCNPSEGRRLDGTCNNLQYPIRGAPLTPFARNLPADFGPEFEVRKTKSGKPPRSPRELRTALLSEGEVPGQVFTHLITYFMLYIIVDFVTNQDTANLVLWNTHCCEESGKYDDQCVPISVPDDDPVHRFTNIRCLNNTKPFTYQNQGCLANPHSTPARITASTPFVDLNPLYGAPENLRKFRVFKGGLLKFEELEGRIWPPSAENGEKQCLLNVPPRETRCHKTPNLSTNGLLGINLMSIWDWRFHNHIATELARVNPHWDDEKLFNTAVDINIAVITQILFYEALPSLMGWDNLIRDGVITNCPGFRDLYDENVIPQTYFEYPSIICWLHLIQPGHVEFYDTDGNYLKKFPEVNLTTRTGFLAIDNNLDYITQGSFRQPTAEFDFIVDNLIAESGLGPSQKAFDITTSDLSKDRLFGYPPYIKYRDYCSGTPHTGFDDLGDYIDPSMLELLKKNYESVQDVDLLAGTWLERPIDGGYVPPTFYCLSTKQYLQLIRYDRHWYERPNRPNAFTYDQLLEVRKATIAYLLCTVGDTVTTIQPQAFFRESLDNPMTSCRNIPSINFEAWREA